MLISTIDAAACACVSQNVFLIPTQKSQPVTEQHSWTQVVYQVQIREGPSDAVIL